jgi:cell pole-organizing protein PopZ
MENQKELEQEPSMEDILSSIKQILSEDDISPNVEEEIEQEQEQEETAPAKDLNEDLDFASFGLDADSDSDAEVISAINTAPPPAPEPISPSLPAAPIFKPEPKVIPKKVQNSSVLDLKEEVVLNSDLIAPKVAQISACALADITKKISTDKNLSLGQKNITLEEITREVMRPMLKSWLDENLPGIVENVVKKEVDRLIDIAKGM